MRSSMGDAQRGARALTRRQFVAGTGAALALALAGCATGAADKDTTRPSDVAAKLTFCLNGAPSTLHTGIYVAQHEGYFDEAGVSVTIVQPGSEAVEDIVGKGRAQLGVSTQRRMAQVVLGSTSPASTAVAAIQQHSDAGVMSRKADGITSARMLENHTYALRGMPAEQAAVRCAVESDGGNFSLVNQVTYQNQGEEAGLDQDAFDAVWALESQAVQQAAVDDFGYSFFRLSAMDARLDCYGSLIIGNTNYLAANPTVVSSFLAACQRGYEFAMADPEAASNILCDEADGLDPTFVRQSQAYLKDNYQGEGSWGWIDASRWATYFTWLSQSETTAKGIDINAGFTTAYLGGQ